MTKSDKRKNNYKIRVEQERRKIREEKRRLKALPKPLRRLEQELDKHIDFMAVYDGYIGDFTGEIVPVKPDENPFKVLNKMELNLPHPNSLDDELIIVYTNCLNNAFVKMGFYLDIYYEFETNQFELYKLLFFYINNPSQRNFDSLTIFKKSYL